MNKRRQTGIRKCGGNGFKKLIGWRPKSSQPMSYKALGEGRGEFPLKLKA